MLAGKAPLEKALKKCLPKIAQLVGIDSAGVYLLKENSTEMELVYTYGVSRRFAAAVALAKIDRGIVGRVFKSGKPVALSRFSPRYPLAASIKKEGLKTIAYIPIRGAGKPRGILCLSNHKPYKFRGTTLRLSLALGRQIGNAWEGSL
ncbi:MAG: GAF domain-containing protein, partial [Candidatus Binatota bacterium]